MIFFSSAVIVHDTKELDAFGVWCFWKMGLTDALAVFSVGTLSFGKDSVDIFRASNTFYMHTQECVFAHTDKRENNWI